MTDEFGTDGTRTAPNELTPTPGVPAPAGPMQKMPNLWKHLTKDAGPADLGAAIGQIEGKMGTKEYLKNPAMQEKLKGLYELRDRSGQDKPTLPERPELGGDWGDGERTPGGDEASVDSEGFDSDDFFRWMPDDLPVSHGDRPIIENFARAMHPHGMSPSQIHSAIRWANGYEGDNLEKDFGSHMQAHGLSRAQAQVAKNWFDGYASSEEALDDAAVAEVDAAIAAIESKMGTPEYIKNPEMQQAYLTLLDVRDGPGNE